MTVKSIVALEEVAFDLDLGEIYNFDLDECKVDFNFGSIF